MNSYPWDYAEGDGHHSPRATVVQVESMGKAGVAIVVVACLLSALALAVSSRSYDRAALAERETKLTAERMRMLQIELEKQGMKLPPIH